MTMIIKNFQDCCLFAGFYQFSFYLAKIKHLLYDWIIPTMLLLIQNLWLIPIILFSNPEIRGYFCPLENESYDQ